MRKYGQKLPFRADTRTTSGCSKRLSSKAAASEEARRTLRYVEPLSDARTPLVDFFSILLEEIGSQVGRRLKGETRGRPKRVDRLSEISL